MNHAANVPRACSVHQHVPVWAPFCVHVTLCPLLPVHHPWTGVCMHLCTSRGLTQLRHSGPVSLHAFLVLGLREAGSGFLSLGSRDAGVPQSFSKSECCAGVPAPPNPALREGDMVRAVCQLQPEPPFASAQPSYSHASRPGPWLYLGAWIPPWCSGFWLLPVPVFSLCCLGWGSPSTHRALLGSVVALEGPSCPGWAALERWGPIVSLSSVVREDAESRVLGALCPHTCTLIGGPLLRNWPNSGISSLRIGATGGLSVSGCGHFSGLTKSPKGCDSTIPFPYTPTKVLQHYVLFEVRISLNLF